MNGVRWQAISFVALASIGMYNGLSFARTEGWHSVFAWGSILFWSIYGVLMTLRVAEQCAVRLQPETTLAFAETGFTIERNGSHTPQKWVPCARVRLVRLTSETLGIYGAWRAFAIVPRTAFPDGGTQVMRYFSDRIVSEGLTETTSRGVTTLVNSVTPLFTRA